MSIGAPANSPLPKFQGTAPDKDAEVVCYGARRLTIQISNQAVLITFGQARGGAIIYEASPELYQPVTGSVTRPFDAFKVRANVPAAQLPAGALQAFAVLVPRQ